MSQDNLHAMPRRVELAEADSEGFVLQIAPEQGIRVSLLEVRDGVPMDGRYECYSLMGCLRACSCHRTSTPWKTVVRTWRSASSSR